jgi:hypothetical protein
MQVAPKITLMKRLVLPFFALLAFSAQAQNILDEKVTFKYTQLPYVKIDGGSKQFNLEVQMNYLQKNTDSLAAYERAKTTYWTQMDAYLDLYELEKAKVDKQHLNNMILWESQVAAGNTAATKPVKPAYPPMTTPTRPRKPFLLQEISAPSVTAAAKIEGLTMSPSATGKITLVFDGFEKGMVKQEAKGTAPNLKYEYLIQYRHPVTVKVELPGKGIVVNMRIPETEGFRAWRTKEFKSKSEFDLWWYDNESIVWEERQKQVVFENMDLINGWMTNQYGYPVATRRIEVYSVKTSKDFDYSDFQNAYTIMESALLMLAYPEQKGDANAKFREAIAIWQNALKESSTSNKKARVDKTVTAATYINLAEAYIWLSDFSNAEMMANKAINIGVNKYERDGRTLLEYARDMKKRFMANQ